ncbi:hypothetical protein M2454_001529 [Aequitasia blattaphilus]|uniref:Rhomboid family intramembrane serine protease n=1 Tax=Aequitasia blattaphilus TaxID=2949332 RepID=A0ABT1E7E2_9FIRM|nr:rhomboid family intramembrane serine protease [Aequitasia blattaphilus]MCP1101636.1 rhomboid family intramembrane serine protease [Aequitasia blattaphilus]MCR8614276.1 rhomboid family intramembrane serine protease [Aequitasia blattaphilus]
MNWLNKLERKFGRYAIPNLMMYIIILYAAGFLIYFMNPDFYTMYLSLDAAAILRGQIWRVITFIMMPPSYNILFFLISLNLYYVIGRQVEMTWGAFRFNVYIFLGIILHVLAALITYAFTGLNLHLGTTYLNLSLFLAFAMLYPDTELLLFFVIPVKIKWLALVDGLFFLYAILQAFLPAYGGAYNGIYYKANALAAFISLLNFLLFFLTTRGHGKLSPKMTRQRNEYRKKMKQAKDRNVIYPNGARHKCAVCGRTELDDPNLEFRYCSKCKGSYEYCQEHLFTHNHVQ